MCQSMEVYPKVSGVPRGSGLILFFICVNDLPDLLQGDVLPFADVIRLITASENFSDLQHDLQHALGLDFGLGPSFE